MSEVIVRERYLKNGKKVYEYCFELAHEGGKRRRRTKSGFATKREARAAGWQALYEYENVGEVVVDNNISYSDFLDFWIENDCKNTCKEQTIKGYEKKIKLYIKPELGAYRIKSINKDNLQAFITDLYNDGFSVNTVTSIKGLLTKSFNFAVDRNYIPASPAVNLVIPKNKQPDRPTRFKQHIFLEKDQVDKIFERFPKGTSSFIPLKIAYHTGMRPGDDDDKIRLNQRKPSKYKGLRRFGPEKNLQRINKFMKERPIFYKNLIQMKENIRFYLRCFYCITKVMILQFNSENRTELARNG